MLLRVSWMKTPFPGVSRKLIFVLFHSIEAIGGNADFAVNLFRVEIGQGGAFVHPAEAIPNASQIQAARHQGSLATRPVPHHSHIANAGSAKNLHRKLLSRLASPRSIGLFLDEAHRY
jgi:hypothetical protein